MKGAPPCATRLRRTCAAAVLFTMPSALFAQTAQLAAPTPNAAPPQPLRLDVPRSSNPFATYLPAHVPPPDLANSARLNSVIRDGKIYLSLRDAIELALENNLDLAIARYNLPIAAADVLRTRAGGVFRGVNTGVVSGTPGGGVGGFGQAAGGAGAGGTTGGAGGAGGGANGLVTSTLGTGTAVSTYDPALTGTLSIEHQTSPEANQQIYGVPSLQANSGIADVAYVQAFPTGTTVEFDFNNERQTTNSRFTNLNPLLFSSYRFSFSQQLLAGFGTGPNLRYLRIAKNNQRISDASFKLQVLSTVTQIANIYWDLVAAYEDEQVKERSLQFANDSTESLRKQLELQAVPAMDVTKAEAEAANRTQELTVAKTNLQLQELLMKNALTKNLDDAVLEAMSVVPTDKIDTLSTAAAAAASTQDEIGQALQNRIDLVESNIDLQNRTISRKAAENALLPTVALVGFYAGSGLAGPLNPAYFDPAQNTSNVPLNYGGAFQNAFNNSSPDYLVGLQMNVPLRNRIAKSDQYRSELEYRQAEIRLQELKKQIRIEVRAAQYTLEQSRARVESARKARDLAQKTFEIYKKEQELGAGSNQQTLSAQRDLSVSESALVAAITAYQKAVVEVQRATGTTLEQNSISIEEAKTGTVASAHP